jgi:hypothetical protein
MRRKAAITTAQIWRTREREEEQVTAGAERDRPEATQEARLATPH